MPIISVEELQATDLDYIIVGGGTAGLTLAARLTEDDSIRVGVIEAGGYHPDAEEINVPGYIGRTLAHPNFDWTFFSVPQKDAGGVPIIQPRGKGLGGSSANNFCGMFRPAKDELDALEKLGNPGWNWDSFLPYFKKSETVCPSGYSSAIAERFAANPVLEYHGTSGPIKTSLPPVLTEAHAILFDAAEVLGVPRNGDMSNGSNIGSITILNSIDPSTARRSYAASDYYAPNASRPNFLVVLDAQVTRVLLEPTVASLKRATGIELVSSGKQFIIRGIRKEVILSAGSFQTPQLLELSGIGNAEILKAHGIELEIDLPGVGENLQDHICARTIVEIDPTYETVDILKDLEVMQTHLNLYKEQKGHLASVAAPGFIFLSSQHLGIKDDQMTWSKIVDGFSEKHIESALPALRSGLQKQYNIQQAWLSADHLSQAEILNYIGHQPVPTPLPPVTGKRYTTLVSAIMHHLSRGTVHLGSSDPLAPPIIDPKYFSNEADLDLLVEAFSFGNRLLETSPLANIVVSRVLPDAELLKPGVDYKQRIRDYVRENSGPVFHPVGTASMLPRADGGVVDSTLKVYGTYNLRVVDLSILPLEVAAHTQATAYAIAEKAADIMKEVSAC